MMEWVVPPSDEICMSYVSFVAVPTDQVKAGLGEVTVTFTGELGACAVFTVNDSDVPHSPTKVSSAVVALTRQYQTPSLKVSLAGSKASDAMFS